MTSMVASSCRVFDDYCLLSGSLTPILILFLGEPFWKLCTSAVSPGCLAVRKYPHAFSSGSVSRSESFLTIWDSLEESLPPPFLPILLTIDLTQPL
ncbi:hypothetical protein GDO81_023446 [Engystomops pustulosus]|uniref:Uncharacterized protein n=1 Tax=Engystomops pustulosus TaxID=76066 RepID=A0AAV6YS86_ENGPU|nr:hypothetical protein GDO81_023446 [Engystomops pustulosus]